MTEFANKKLRSENLELAPAKIMHYRHPEKNGLLTIAANDDDDIPPMTMAFLTERAQIRGSDVPGSS